MPSLNSPAPGGTSRPAPARASRPTASTHPAAAGLALLACLALAGCTAHADLTVSAAGTYDVHLELRDSTGTVYPADGDDPATRCTPLTDPALVGAPAGTSVSATPVGKADDDAGLGCEITITGVPVADQVPASTGGDDAAASSAPQVTGSSAGAPLVSRDGALYVVDLSAAATVLAGAGEADAADAPSGSSAPDAPGTDDAASGTGQGSGSDTAPTDPLSAVDVKVSVTFPGAVVDAGGGTVSASGRTVTWTGAQAVAAGIRATGHAEEGASLTWWERYHTPTLVGAGLACLAAACGVVYRWRRTRRR